ncbi:Synaptotagmin-15 [Lamellibrachia satsuma]|nr:Synaptotagmin-15 [Lamellibrachia satsuma]
MNQLAAAGVSSSPPSHDVQRSWSRFRGRPSRSPTRTALTLPAGVYEPRMSLTDSERTSDFSAFGTRSKDTPDASTNAEQSRAFSVRFGVSHGVVVAAIAVFLIIILLVLCWLVRGYFFRAKSNSTRDVQFDELDGYKTYSANLPSSDVKRRQFAYRHTTRPQDKAAVMRSLTADMIPDFTLPPERVQPLTSRPVSTMRWQSTLGCVQPDLYICSMDEASSGDPPPNPWGRIWFSLVYDAAVEQLTVHLNKAKYLRGRDKTNAPRDPFVKVYLLPDENTCQQSRVRRKTLAPKFNDTFVFQVPADEVKSRTLRMSVYDVDKRRVRHSLGHVLLHLRDVDLIKEDLLWRDMEPVSQDSTSLGEIYFSLAHKPTVNKLKVDILRARNLRKLEYDTEEGTCVRVQLVRAARVIKIKKTQGQRGTCSPTFNESFTFTVPPGLPDDCSVAVTVMTMTSTRHEEEYGKVTVGPSSDSEGVMHWHEMKTQPGVSVTRWHDLSSNAASSRESGLY